MKRKMIVIVNGYPLSGKDTAVDMLSKRLRELRWFVYSRSSIEPVKEITRQAGIEDEPKTPEKRALWAEIKAAFEKYDRHLTRSLLENAYSRLRAFPQNSIFFIHVREPEAIQFMWDNLEPGIEWLTIFVERPDAERVTSNTADMEVENYAYMARVVNAGTLDNLQDSCSKLAEIIHQGNTE